MDESTRREIQWACQLVVLEVANAMDSGEDERIVNFFTADCEFVRPSTFPNNPLRGPEGILAALNARPEGYTTRHICTNILVEVIDEDKAIARSYFSHYGGCANSRATTAVPLDGALRSVGDYTDHLVKTPTGWRVAKRVGQFIFGGR